MLPLQSKHVFDIMDKDKLSNFIKQIEKLTTKPEKYLSIEKAQVDLAKLLTKNLYDFTKQKERPENKNVDVLKKLVTINLDEEQIWQQIDLQNNSVCADFIHKVAHLSARSGSLNFPLKEKETIKSNLTNASTENKIEQDKIKKKVKHPKGKPSVVDDKFFKLYEMEHFLEAVEKEEGKKNSNADVDYFEDDLSSLSDNSEKNFYYNDFFDEPDEDNKISFDEDNTECNKKRVKFLLNKEQEEDDIGNSDESDNLENFGDETDDENIKNNFYEEENDDISVGSDKDNYAGRNEDYELVKNEETPKQPSTFELRQERLKFRIKNLEEEALKEKPWQLKGEVTASSRPQNSLLEEYVEFDIAARPAPVLTEKSTLKLEDVIIQRIKDAAWDDVVRKIKPIENNIEYKKELVLDQEKSKLSLAQIYEKEYLRQLENKSEDIIEKPEKEPPEHQEIRIMMNTLFSKLDALSNFHFTPKQVEPEVKIVSNLPAISMEEVAPVATSDAALLAPEEVKPKSKGDLIGKSERTKTDKKRERRQRKLKQKLKFKQMEAKAKLKLENGDSKNLKKEKIPQKVLQKITKSSNITQLNEEGGGKYIKSSNAFFSKLQNETKSLIKKKGLDKTKMKLSKKVSSKKPGGR